MANKTQPQRGYSILEKYTGARKDAQGNWVQTRGAGAIAGVSVSGAARPNVSLRTGGGGTYSPFAAVGSIPTPLSAKQVGSYAAQGYSPAQGSGAANFLASGGGFNKAGQPGYGSGFGAGVAGQQVQKSLNQANAANIGRYSEGKGELLTARETARGLYDVAESEIAKVGEGAREDVNRGAKRTYAEGIQRLISSGLSGSTVTGTLGRGVEEDRLRAMQRVDESQAGMRSSMALQRANMEMGAARDVSGFIERRTDLGPDTATYANLMKGAAAASVPLPQYQAGGQAPTAPQKSLLPGSPEWRAERERRGLDPYTAIDNARMSPNERGYYKEVAEGPITNTVNGRPGWTPGYDPSGGPLNPGDPNYPGPNLITGRQDNFQPIYDPYSGNQYGTVGAQAPTLDADQYWQDSQTGKLPYEFGTDRAVYDRSGLFYPKDASGVPWGIF